MTDPKSVVAEEKVVESETTQVKSPQTEGTITESQTTQGESGDQGSTVEESDNLPVGSENWTAEQRKAFQEQRLEIKQLKEEKQVREQSESAFKVFRPTIPPVSQQGEIRIENYQDPLTGETNWQAYNQAVNNALYQAKQVASYEAQQTASDLIDENNARIKHPDLFTNPELEREIADKWVAAKLRGENLSVSQIAERIAKREQRIVSKAEKIGAEKILNEVSEKEKAALSVSGQSAEASRQVASAEDLENLREKTRRGDKDAVATRISKIPWANK